ncbi:probable E3 SUMO-protein ligase RNF212 isoform X2 [Varanus komodoensis]|uniref:probable E3 SUMO-protein ligase RNF212 isoform X2 n=1 Tax=Varanus komodoensis TaxID=61221 RepID=UPI001CF78416|nr:probable E3 SUMO-protein ligase RNF212 isoform X2 [Varanus komodoensis]
MAALVFCNSCFQKPRGASPKFCLTNCGHVVCERCLRKGKKDECMICRATCRTIVLSKEMNSNIQSLFMGIDGLCRKYAKEVTQIAQFQEKHRRRLLAHYRGKTETVTGPTRISLISPPQNGHMGSVTCRSSRLSGITSCQKDTPGSIRSSPLNMPNTRTSYMSPFVSSQNRRNGIPDTFGLRTTQPYHSTPPSSLSTMTRRPISLASILQRQHLSKQVGQ